MIFFLRVKKILKHQVLSFFKKPLFFDLIVLNALVGLSILFRFYTFEKSVIDWDESTYILIGKALLEGKQLYLDVWDIKTPGIFWIYALIGGAFKNMIYGSRLITSITLGFSSFMIYQIIKLFYKKESFPALLALLGAVFYLSILSAQNPLILIKQFPERKLLFHLFGPNTEIFFNFFTLMGFWVFFRFFSKKRFLFLSGCLLSIGFFIKYIIILEMGFLLVALGLLLKQQTNQTLFSKKFVMLFSKKSAYLILGYALPTFIWVGLFWYQNNGDLFLNHLVDLKTYLLKNESSSLASKASLHFKTYLIYTPILIFPISFFCLTSLLMIAKKIFLDRKPPLIFEQITLLWCGLYPIVMIIGKQYIHYTYQLFPAFSCLAVLTFSKSNFKKKSFRLTAISVYLILTCLVMLLPIQKQHQKKYPYQSDFPRQIADFISKDAPTKDFTLFCENSSHIIYYLLDKTPLTKYIHPSLLYNSKRFAFDAKKEYNHIYAQKPTYVIFNPKKPSSKKITGRNYLKEYQTIRSFGSIQVLKRK